MKDLIFILDQGSTQHKLVVFNPEGAIVDVLCRAAPPLEEHKDGLGFDPYDLLQVSNALIEQAFKKYPNDRVTFGFANQGESVVAWDLRTGLAISQVISWQCQRAQEFLATQKKHFEEIYTLSGLMPSAYFSAAKLGHLLNTHGYVGASAAKNQLALGTLDAWMIYNWTRARHFITDPTTACRTQLYDIHKRTWSSALCSIFGVPENSLPKIIDNRSWDYLCDDGPFLTRPTSLAASFCDQTASLIGHGGIEAPILKVSFGTGAFVDLSVGPAVQAPCGLLKSVLFGLTDSSEYYVEGGVLSFASALDWLSQIFSFSQAALFSRLNHDTGIYVRPAFVGLGAPYFQSEVKTLFDGIGLNHTAYDLAVSAVQALVFRVVEIIGVMKTSYDLPGHVRVDGGLSQNEALMQFFSDAVAMPIVAAHHHEMTSFGVARTIVKNRLDRHLLLPMADKEKRFQPHGDVARRLFERWKNHGI